LIQLFFTEISNLPIFLCVLCFVVVWIRRDTHIMIRRLMKIGMPKWQTLDLQELKRKMPLWHVVVLHVGLVLFVLFVVQEDSMNHLLLAPEIIQGKKYTEKADVYSVWLMLFLMKWLAITYFLHHI
jgi:hypothetical protein